ncbi:DnaJ molecular chaperone [uncultured virus]|nr:DnaJ molecular chaperone [uncultured virus]
MRGMSRYACVAKCPRSFAQTDYRTKSVEFMAREYKQNTDLPDLYNILGLTADVSKKPDCDQLIQKAYVKKAKACHPDKYPGRKDVAEVFRLLTEAYDILRNEKQRVAYNHKLALDKQSSSDFTKLKQRAMDYVETMGEFKEPTDTQKLEFKDQMTVLDRKHNFNPELDTPLSLKGARKKLETLSTDRKTQDSTYKPERLFDEGGFDQGRFNALFDQVHQRDTNTIMPHSGVPSAWNDANSVMSFSAFDDLDSLYVDDGSRCDTGRQSFGNVDFGGSTHKLTREDAIKIKGADYVTDHNVLSEDYYKDMKAKLQGRKSSTGEYETMSYSDFTLGDMAGYGIFDQLGFDFTDRLALDVDEDDISKKFDQLMEKRRKEGLDAPKR